MLWPITGQMPWLGPGGPVDLGTACIPCSGHTVSSDMEALCKEMDVGILELACAKLSPAQSRWQDREKGPCGSLYLCFFFLPIFHFLTMWVRISTSFPVTDYK